RTMETNISSGAVNRREIQWRRFHSTRPRNSSTGWTTLFVIVSLLGTWFHLHELCIIHRADSEIYNLAQQGMRILEIFTVIFLGTLWPMTAAWCLAKRRGYNPIWGIVSVLCFGWLGYFLLFFFREKRRTRPGEFVWEENEK